MAEVYEVEDEAGHIYKFTGNHKLLTKDGWKRVDELTTEDEIVSFE
jgi:intein/homing endonuclease